jgi:YHS domain-containing protein
MEKRSRRIVATIVTVSVLLSTVGFVSAQVYVRGHVRSDGTYVAPHYRSPPDNSVHNNWNTYPNVNPYTGETGKQHAPSYPSRMPSYAPESNSSQYPSMHPTIDNPSRVTANPEQPTPAQKLEKFDARFQEQHPILSSVIAGAGRGIGGESVAETHRMEFARTQQEHFFEEQRALQQEQFKLQTLEQQRVHEQRMELLGLQSKQQNALNELPPISPPLGLDGYCPVAMRKSWQWVAGDSRWGAMHRGRTYLFSSEASRDEFLTNPDFYAPALSGSDPVLAIEQNQIVAGRREHSLDYDNQIFLFSNEVTLEQFRRSPDRYVVGVRQAMGLTHQRRR